MDPNTPSCHAHFITEVSQGETRHWTFVTKYYIVELIVAKISRQKSIYRSVRLILAILKKVLDIKKSFSLQFLCMIYFLISCTFIVIFANCVTKTVC